MHAGSLKRCSVPCEEAAEHLSSSPSTAWQEKQRPRGGTVYTAVRLENAAGETLACAYVDSTSQTLAAHSLILSVQSIILEQRLH